MICAVIGLFKEPFQAHGSDLEAEINEQLGQPFLRLVNAGYLRGEQEENVGILALIEVDTFARAQAFLNADPFQRAGYFEHVRIARYEVEVGRLG